MTPFADQFASRACSWTIDERRTIQVWRRHDGKYRVVEYREAREQACDDYASAYAVGMRWANEAGLEHP